MTDKYFQRAKRILEKERINPIVRYQVFCRKDVDNPDLKRVVDYILDNLRSDIKLDYGLGKIKAGFPMMKYEGRLQDLIALETDLLSILSSELTGPLNEEDFETIKKNAKSIKEAAQDKAVFYFGARHFDPDYDERISSICHEAGFSGCSTDVGAKAWGSEGVGTIPHALILGIKSHMIKTGNKRNPTAYTTMLFDKHMPKSVPRIALIDTFNREITDSIETALSINDLSGVRIDTCGENTAQQISNLNIPMPENKYLDGTGVTIKALWSLRYMLPKKYDIMISSGFNAEKTKAFMLADKMYQTLYDMSLFNGIGTGSLLDRAITATSDIVAFFDEDRNDWIPLSKTGRKEL
jgi:nicotinate phosphoribosyltransferase